MGIDPLPISTAIEKRIEEFLAKNNPRFDWLKRAVSKYRFLPLYVGWVAIAGIRPDTSFVRWDHENDPDTIKPLPEPFWQRMAACQGAKLYPELRSLIPQRPSSAQTCNACSGSGQLTKAPKLICQCGGVGWIIPGEQQGISLG